MSTLKNFYTLTFTHLGIGFLVLLVLATAGCSGWAASSPVDEPATEKNEIIAIEPEADLAAGETRLRDGSEAPVLQSDMEEAPVEEAAAPAEAPAPAGGLEVAQETEAMIELESGAEDSESSSPAPLPTATFAPSSDMAEATTAEFGRAESAVIEVQQAEPLRAGEVDDNAQWDDYLLYRRTYQGLMVHDRDVSERYVIEVQDGQGNPILDATVRIFLDGQQSQEIYSARTYANGQVLFHPLALDLPLEQADQFWVEVQKDNLVEQFTLTRLGAQTSTAFSERWTATLDARPEFEALNLDVLFLIDATGSMADEIGKIQSTIFDVAAQIDALPGQPEARYGLVAYRDRGDSFVSNSYEFTPDVREFHRNLSTVYADGGGDYPESLNEGLYDALHSVEWRGSDTIQLIFLVADAPPHLDYAQDYDYAVEMDIAAQRGIKIFPIASSGLDEQGEYIFRQLAQYTQGRFIFLTYEGPTNGGAPGDVTTHHVDDYSVANLDDLLVKLVSEELAYQSPQLARGQQ